MTEEKKWYAVYTRSRSEKKVADLLQKKHIEQYCPLNRVLRQWADRKKFVYEPLFTSYVFVRISTGEFLPTLQTDGVMHFVQYLNKPAVIRNEEIEQIRQLLTEGQNVRLERQEFQLRDRVMIMEGAFTSVEGEVVEVRSRTVRVSLPTLGYTLLAEIAKSHLENLSAVAVC